MNRPSDAQISIADVAAALEERGEQNRALGERILESLEGASTEALLREAVLLLLRHHKGDAYHGWSSRDNCLLETLIERLERPWVGKRAAS